jgi:hypothetical protein
MEFFTLLTQLHIGSEPNYFNGLDPIQENEQIEDIKTHLNELSKMVEHKQDLKQAITLVNHLLYLENYTKLLAQPIYINQFKDKNNNLFLQARTTIKDDFGKTKWVNAYVGTLKDYPKGINDIEAIKKGQILIRKKLKGYFGLK